MNTEEKARAYEEALEKTKELLDSPRTCFDIEQLKDIFPELRESEDERIRKNILVLVKKHTVNHERCQMEAYLEKQKNAFENGRQFGIIQEQARQELEWPDERQQKLFESGRGLYYYDGEKTTYCGYPATEENPHDKGCINYMDGSEWVHIEEIEPKPAEWSEEDEEALREVKLNFELNHDDMTPTLVGFYERFFNKLKSLRPQQKAEWSKKDEEMLECVIMDVESAKENYLKSTTQVVRQGAILADKELAWLKSLRPRWKPSEEDERMRMGGKLQKEE